jgi:hypothetical protein
MNKLIRELDIPFTPNLDLVKYHDISMDNSTRKHFLINVDKRDEDVVRFLYLEGLRVNHSEMFYTPPYNQRNIHIDGNVGQKPYREIFKINWIYGAPDSTMKWYDVKSGYEPNKSKTPAGTYAYLFDEDKCDLLFETSINRPAIVQAGLPHTVNNNTNQRRWCVSYQIDNLDINVPITWNSIVLKLGKYFI